MRQAKRNASFYYVIKIYIMYVFSNTYLQIDIKSFRIMYYWNHEYFVQKIESESYVTMRILFSLLFNGRMYQFLSPGLCVFRQNHIMIIDYRNKDKTGIAFAFLPFFFCIKQKEIFVHLLLVIWFSLCGCWSNKTAY